MASFHRPRHELDHCETPGILPGARLAHLSGPDKIRRILGAVECRNVGLSRYRVNRVLDRGEGLGRTRRIVESWYALVGEDRVTFLGAQGESFTSVVPDWE